MAQILRPASTVSAGDWTVHNAATHHEALRVESNAAWIKTAAGVLTTARFALDVGDTPEAGTRTLRVGLSRLATNRAVTIEARLYEGATLKGTIEVTNPGTAHPDITTGSVEVTEPISDYSNLFIEVETTSAHAQGEAFVYYVAFDVPDASVAEPIVVNLPIAGAQAGTQVLTPDVAGPSEPVVVDLTVASAEASAGGQIGTAKRMLLAAASAAALLLTPQVAGKIDVALPVASASASSEVLTGQTTAPPISELVDDFSGPEIDLSKWFPRLYGDYAALKIEGEQLHISYGVEADTWAYLDSSKRYDITGGILFVEAVSVVVESGSETGLIFSYDDNNRYVIGFNETSCFWGRVIGGTGTWDGQTYNAENHRWIGLRHNAGTNEIEFLTSTDGASWTVRGTAPAHFVDGIVSLYGGNWQEKPSRLAIYDNLNTVGLPVDIDLPVAGASAGAGGSLGVLHDLETVGAEASAQNLTVDKTPSEGIVLPLASAEASAGGQLGHAKRLSIAGAEASAQSLTYVPAGVILLPVAGATASAGGQLGQAKRLSLAGAEASTEDLTVDVEKVVSLPVAGATAIAGGQLSVLHTLEVATAEASAEGLTPETAGVVEVGLPVAGAEASTSVLTPHLQVIVDLPLVGGEASAEQLGVQILRLLPLAEGRASARNLTPSTASVVTLPIAQARAATDQVTGRKNIAVPTATASAEPVELVGRTQIIVSLPIAEADSESQVLTARVQELVTIPIAGASAEPIEIRIAQTVLLPAAQATASSLRVGIVRLLPLATAEASSVLMTPHISPKVLLPVAGAEGRARPISTTTAEIWKSRPAPPDSVWNERASPTTQWNER